MKRILLIASRSGTTFDCPVSFGQLFLGNVISDADDNARSLMNVIAAKRDLKESMSGQT